MPQMPYITCTNMYCQCNGVHPYIRNLKYLIQPLATSHRKFTGFSVVKFLQGTSLRMNSFNISMLVEMKKWDECVLFTVCWFRCSIPFKWNLQIVKNEASVVLFVLLSDVICYCLSSLFNVSKYRCGLQFVNSCTCDFALCVCINHCSRRTETVCWHVIKEV